MVSELCAGYLTGRDQHSFVDGRRERFLIFRFLFFVDILISLQVFHETRFHEFHVNSLVPLVSSCRNMLPQDSASCAWKLQPSKQ